MFLLLKDLRSLWIMLLVFFILLIIKWEHTNMCFSRHDNIIFLKLYASGAVDKTKINNEKNTSDVNVFSYLYLCFFV